MLHLDGDEGTVAGVVAVVDAAHEDVHVAIQLPLSCGRRVSILAAADIILSCIVKDGPDAIVLQILHFDRN